MSEKKTKWYEEQLRIYECVPPHLAHATTLTREGHIDETNRLYRRSKKGRIRAHEVAILNLPFNARGDLPLPRKAAGTWHVPPEHFTR